VQVAGNKIHFLFKTQFFHQALIVREVVVHHGHHLAMLEALNLNAVAIKRGEALRPDHASQSALLGPFCRSSDQCFGNINVIHGIEEVEGRIFDAMNLIEGFEFHGGNAPNHLITTAGNEEIGV